MAKDTRKFRLEARTSVDVWGNEYNLPVYDGLHIYTTGKNAEHVGKILWDAKTENCYLQLDEDEELDDFIDSFETFKEFCTTIRLAKFHIKLAHNVTNVDSSDDSN